MTTKLGYKKRIQKCRVLRETFVRSGVTWTSEPYHALDLTETKLD